MQVFSVCQRRGRVVFPAFTGERIYMHAFTARRGLPPNLHHWQKTVDAMLDGIEAPGRVWLMVDQGIVQAGTTHRRPGLHVDGTWFDSKPMWDDYVQLTKLSELGHRSEPPLPRHKNHIGSSQKFYSQLLVMASDVYGCCGYEGEYTLPVNFVGGDRKNIDTSAMDRIEFEAHSVYMGNAMDMLHESLVIPHHCRRTMVRLNVETNKENLVCLTQHRHLNGMSMVKPIHTPATTTKSVPS